MKPILKRLRSEDKTLVLKACHLFGTTLDEAAVKAHLASERDHLLMAFVNGEAVAFLRAHELPRLDGPPKMLLYDIETYAKYRRLGIARALVEALKNLARERGARTIFLLTNSANEAAMKFYAATGAKRPHDDDVLWSYDL